MQNSSVFYFYCLDSRSCISSLRLIDLLVTERRDITVPIVKDLCARVILVTRRDQLSDVTQDRRISIAPWCIIFSMFHGILRRAL